MQLSWKYRKGIKKALLFPLDLIASRHAKKGRALLRAGNAPGARQSSLDGLRWYADSDPCYLLLAETVMPGWHYLRFLQEVHLLRKPATYVEIGVSTGLSFQLVSKDTKAVGIDPNPRVTWDLPASSTIYAVTSDEFFETRNLATEIGSPSVDMAFIDGLHTFEQTLLDFIHIERFCRPGTILFLHDCLPVTRLTAEKNRQTSFWCGDVWKMIYCLQKYRPDLNISTIGAYPSGLAAITKLNPASAILAQKFDEIVAELGGLALGYSVLDFPTDALRSSLPSSHATAAAIVELARTFDLA